MTLLEYFGGQDGLQGFTGELRRPQPVHRPRVGIPGVVDLAAVRLLDAAGRLDRSSALCCLIVWLLMRSPWGRVLKGIREDEDAVRSLGKNVYAYKMQA